MTGLEGEDEISGTKVAVLVPATLVKRGIVWNTVFVLPGLEGGD